MSAKDSKGRYLPRAKRKRPHGLDLTSFAGVLKDYYKSDKQLLAEVMARAALHNIDHVLLKQALGWDIDPAKTDGLSMRDRRVARRIAKNWKGALRPLGEILRASSPLLALLPKEKPWLTECKAEWTVSA